ncbi:MAG: hypothetical protein SynsKO_37570 [Synoicihabitans sp.]
MTRRNLISLLSTLVVAALGVGCANYQLGTGAAPLEFKQLYVAPIESKTLAPQSVAPISRAIREAVLTDGRVELAASPTEADAVLTMVLIDRERTFTSVQPQDTALARKFDITLTVVCSLTNPSSGQVYFADREIEVTRQIYVDGGQNPAEFQVVPQLAHELGDRISHSVLDVW